MQYWQIAAGSHGRDYSEYFLKYGIACVGECFNETREQVENGDVVILKVGKTIKAAGIVVERNGKHGGCHDKEWVKDFDGWDLSSYCYVDWKKAPDDVYRESLTRATISRVGPENIPIITEAKHILATETSFQPEPTEPEPVKAVTDEEILKALIKAGLGPSSADEVTNTISRIRLLADYYYHNQEWEDVREHETRTFLVVPLLLALGWSQQQIKIELPAGNRNRVDIACFRGSYQRNKEDCVAIIETKSFSSGLDYAGDQGTNYAENFPSCKAVITTNGYCYRIYKKNQDAGKFDEEPHAYMNLLKPKDKYPLRPDIEGALEAIKWLLPNSPCFKE